MKFSFVPRYSFRSITDISPGFLRKNGVNFLMLDLDNTIAYYTEDSPTDSIKQWVANMKENSVNLFFISNSKRQGRVEIFAEAFGVNFITDAHKPSPKSLMQAMESAGFSTFESALLGDQIYIDTLAANRAGVISIVVRPLSLKNPLYSLRYAVEAPFRAACARKMFTGAKHPSKGQGAGSGSR